MQENHKLDPAKWVEKYSDYLFNFAVVRLSDAEQSADVVQETFLAALRARKNFQGNSSEKTWLTSILKRKIIDIYRKRASSKESSMEEYKELITDGDYYQTDGPFPGSWKEGKMPASDSLFPQGELENKELRAILEKCIANLPENLSAVFTMKLVDEASSDEVCKELGITASNLWVMMHRARLKMRNCIERAWN